MRGERPPLHRVTLANGLRVLLAPDPGAPRVTVCVHYGVGFRSEPPSREGFAHLFEHLMFRGSESLPNGAFYDHVHTSGGEANGTTHQDYTDYYQAVPAEALEQALFSEADRMRAPRFTPDSLAEQLDGVAQEIHQATVARPYGGFPWPLLPGLLYASHANAHDGYGDIAELRHTTPDQCAEFFDTHYAPSNAVLTVGGGFDLRAGLELVERHFADIPDRPVPPRPELDEPAPAADRWSVCTEAGVSATAVAVGYRLPDPGRDLPGHLAHRVLARLLAGEVDVDSSCGFFGPLDARSPDTLVLTGRLAQGSSPQDLLARIEGQWGAWAEGEGRDDAVARAVGALVLEHHRDHDDLQVRTRALGRLETLFGRAELLDEIPLRLAEIGPSQVAGAARGLLRAHKAVLVIEPGPVRTRPAPAVRTAPAAFGASPATDSAVSPATASAVSQAMAPAAAPATADRPHRTAVQLGSSPAGPRCVPVPEPRPAKDPALAVGADAVLGNGLRLVAVHTRTPVVELRLRRPLGVLGWTRPDAVDALLRLLNQRARTAWRAASVRGDIQWSTDGQWLEATGHVAPSDVDTWLSVLADLASAPQPAAREGARPRTPAAPPAPHGPPLPRPADRVADDALRRRLADRPTAAPDDPAALHRSVMDPAGATLIAVGALDGARLVARAEQLLAGWTSAGAEEAPEVRSRPHDGADLLVVRQDHYPGAHLTLHAPASMDGPDEAARYVATAVFGGYFGSRLAARLARRGTSAYVALAGRDVLGDRPRAYVRAWLPEAWVPEALGELRAEALAMATDPPGTAEVSAARDFCAGQLLSVFDSQAGVADVLCRTVAYGQAPTWAARLPRLMREASTADVARVGGELFGARPLAGVLVGRTGPGPVDETELRTVRR
ncbi:M16 family metallopeptidase [Streptomyces sp. NPDC059957]|uniref:M16 family metallopeptidase n=1 Tax=unclassified Streptomyces TaxID=2593676 RepID=UPI003646F7A4